MIDEISLKSNLHYDWNLDVVIGFEDTGPCIGRTAVKATNALVFMLRGLSSNWTQPVGYIFSAIACKAVIAKALLENCLTKCKQMGLNVKAMVSEQGPNFQELTNKLVTSVEKPYFMHSNHKYFYMFVTTHLNKNIWNNLN